MFDISVGAALPHGPRESPVQMSMRACSLSSPASSSSLLFFLRAVSPSRAAAGVVGALGKQMARPRMTARQKGGGREAEHVPDRSGENHMRIVSNGDGRVSGARVKHKTTLWTFSALSWLSPSTSEEPRPRWATRLGASYCSLVVQLEHIYERKHKHYFQSFLSFYPG